MTINSQTVQAAFQLDDEEIEHIKQLWKQLMNTVMWCDVSSAKIGALPRARKRVLEVGESFRSFIAPKDWIDQPRQQLKSALGASVKLRDSLAALKTVSQHMNQGLEVAQYQTAVEELENRILEFIMPLENRWADILDSE